METEQEPEKRTATDILLSLESRVITLEKRFQNVENLLKIMLNKMNQTPAPVVVSAPVQKPVTLQPQVQAPQAPQVRPMVINKDNFENRPKTSKFADLAASKGIVVDDEPAKVEGVFVAKPSSLPPDPNGDDMLEAPVRGNVRNQRGPKSTGSKSSVSQIIKRDDDTPIFIANVQVLDENGTMINQTRTNKIGRWMVALSPGKSSWWSCRKSSRCQRR